MRWTLGLLLLASAGCGYRQTKMVACPETGCPESYASSSPQGTRYTPPKHEETLPPTVIAPPIEPLPYTEPPPPEPPVPTP